MSLTQLIQQHVDMLPPHQQAEVLDFVMFLEQKKQPAAVSVMQLPKRTPDALAASVAIVGDIVDVIPADDWDLPT